MALVRTLTNGQKIAIHNQSFKLDHMYNVIEDINDNHIISEEEVSQTEDIPQFNFIKTRPQIEFVPKVPVIEIIIDPERPAKNEKK